MSFNAPLLDLWNSSPCLQRAFADFQHFAESHAVACGDGQFARDRLANVLAYFDERLNEASARLALARRPISTAIPARSCVQRVGLDRLVLWLYGPISPFAAAKNPIIDLQVIVDAIEKNRDLSLITLRIDSAGGNPFVGEDIFRVLGRHPARKVAIIDGACLSAANWFASAADRVLMRANATWLSHRSRTMAEGDCEVLMRAMNMIRTSDFALARSIASRRRIDFREFLALQEQERYLSASEAMDLGLADQIISGLPNSAAGVAPALQSEGSD